MQMRRIVIASLVILGLVLSGVVYLLWNQSKESSDEITAPVLFAIPEKSPLILRINQALELISLQDKIGLPGQSLHEWMAWSRAIEMLASIDSLLKHHPEKAPVTFPEFWLSASPSANHYATMLFTGELSRAEYKLLNNSLGSVEKAGTYDEVSYDQILPLSLNRTNPIYSFHRKGISVWTSDKFCLEESIRQLNRSDEMSPDSSLQRALQVANRNVLLNVFVNHQEVGKFLSVEPFAMPEVLAQLPAGFASYTAWDMIPTSEGIYLNGFTLTAAEPSQRAKFWMQQKQGNSSLLSYIPASHLNHSMYHAAEFKQFGRQLQSHAQQSNWPRDREVRLKELKTQGFGDIDERIYELLDEEFAFVRTAYDALTPENARFLLLDIFSNRAAEKWLDDFYRSNSIVTGQWAKPYQLDASTTFDIRQFPFSDVPYLLFGDAFRSVQANWVCLYRDVLIFAQDYNSLVAYLNEVFRGNTVSNEKEYRDFEAHLSGEFNQFHYVNLRNSFQQWRQSILLDDSLLYNDRDKALMFQRLSMQLGTGKQAGMISNDVFIQHHPDVSDKPQTVWQLALDSSVSIKPAIVKNHVTREKEILVQDHQHKIYLINPAGRILWSKQLEGPIISEIFQVDYFKNEKLQYLFNTRDKIHWIDRNGNDVKRYPIALHSPASNGLALVDYQDKKDYRIFIATSDRKMLLYAKDGNLISDWSFKEAESPVQHPLKYFEQDRKDYLAFADQNRVYLLNRRGQVRIEPKWDFRPSNNPVYFDNTNPDQTACFVVTDTQGKIVLIGMDGEVKLVEVGDFSPEHTFLLADVNGNGEQDFVFTDESKLMVFDWRGEQLFSVDFESPITYTPVYYEFPGNVKKLGVVTLKERLIYLVNSDGSIYSGFPVNGTTQFSISSLNKDGRFNLLVGNLQGFLLQYDVK